jgi:hypothetical protein
MRTQKGNTVASDVLKMEAFEDKTVLLPFKSMKLKIQLEVSRHAIKTI